MADEIEVFSAFEEQQVFMHYRIPFCQTYRLMQLFSFAIFPWLEQARAELSKPDRPQSPKHQLLLYAPLDSNPGLHTAFATGQAKTNRNFQMAQMLEQLIHAQPGFYPQRVLCIVMIGMLPVEVTCWETTPQQQQSILRIQGKQTSILVNWNITPSGSR